MKQDNNNINKRTDFFAFHVSINFSAFNSSMSTHAIHTVENESFSRISKIFMLSAFLIFRNLANILELLVFVRHETAVVFISICESLFRAKNKIIGFCY